MALFRILALFFVGLSACSPFVKPTLPGESSYAVKEVRFQKGLELDPGALIPTLSVRADTLLIPGQPYNPYRLAEDRRRVAAFWSNFGYFDVEVEKGHVDFLNDKEVEVTWRLSEGPRYRLETVRLQNAPSPYRDDLERAVGFSPGDPLDLQGMRVKRHVLADVLRDAGYMRAEVYSRSYVNKESKSVDWVFFIDPGPKTRVGKISVKGNRKVSEAWLLDRAGYKPSDELNLETLRKRELDLMDTGAFNSARLFVDVGTEFEDEAVPWESRIPPDEGGQISKEQVNALGDFVPRLLPEEVDMRIEVVEAPEHQVKAHLGAGVDLHRFDVGLGGKYIARNAFGAMHHFVAEGRLGYGLRWRDGLHEPMGLYGSAKLQSFHPGAIGRIGDLRVSLSFDEDLYPGFHWRTGALGIGLRTLISRGFFFDIEPRFRWDDGVGIGKLSGGTQGINEKANTLAGELRTSLVWDTRDDGVEALDGGLLALHLSLLPVGDLSYLKAHVDGRYMLPFNQDMGLAFRLNAAWVKDFGDDGLPMGSRLYGGGAFGMRGFYENYLSLYQEACGGAAGSGKCRNIPVGGESLLEASAEFRWLPFRKQFGATLFFEAGAVGKGANPFEKGLNLATGIGLRARLWHIPIGLDVAWRFFEDKRFQSLNGLDKVLVFLRVGEAF